MVGVDFTFLTLSSWFSDVSIRSNFGVGSLYRHLECVLVCKFTDSYQFEML